MRAFIVFTSLILAVVINPAFAQDPPQRSVEIEKMNVFVCPQHPQMKATWQSRCPICGAPLQERGRTSRGPAGSMGMGLGMGNMMSGMGGMSRPEQSVQVKVEKMSVFVCPQHPGMKATWPARCPMCGARMRERTRQSEGRERMRTFVCPAHPRVKATWSAQCPICGRRLQERARPSSDGRMMLPESHWLDPDMVLMLRRQLNLTDEQVEKLTAAANRVSRYTRSVLNEEQIGKLRSYGQRWAPRVSPVGVRRWQMGDPRLQTMGGATDPSGLTFRDVDEEDGLGGDEGFDQGFEGDQGFGDEGFGGEEGFEGEGFGNDEFGPGFENGEGFGNEEFGPGFEGEGGFGENEGFGRGFEGGERFGNEGFEGERGFGGEAFGRGFGNNEGFREGARSEGRLGGTEGSRAGGGFGGRGSR